jgi:hypothetical protein
MTILLWHPDRCLWIAARRIGSQHLLPALDRAGSGAAPGTGNHDRLGGSLIGAGFFRLTGGSLMGGGAGRPRGSLIPDVDARFRLRPCVLADAMLSPPRDGIDVNLHVTRSVE